MIRRVGAGGLVVTVPLIALVTLTPQSGHSAHGRVSRAMLSLLHRVGVPETFSYAAWEVTANVIMFLPLGFFLALACWRAGRWFLVGVPTAASLLIESAQYFFLPSRYPTISDVAANSAGGIVGFAAGALVLWAVSHPRFSRRRGEPS